MTDACWAVVPAAGIGSRMGSELPKQYISLAGKPILQHALECLCEHPAINGVVVALAEDDRWFDELDFECKHLLRAPGGEQRCHSVLNGLVVLADVAADEDWVLVHDAARPCLRTADISRLIEAVQAQDNGGLLALPVRDTMKRADSNHCIEATIERDGLWHALTPQMFRLGELRKALEAAINSGDLVTDEAQAMEGVGAHPLLVEGSEDNIKVTRPGDLVLAELYLQQMAVSS